MTDAISRKLLIVEDDPGIQSQLRWCFEDYEVIASTDRASAIAELHRTLADNAAGFADLVAQTRTWTTAK